MSRALELGYALYGNPAVTLDGETSLVAQAVIWPGERPPAKAELAHAGEIP